MQVVKFVSYYVQHREKPQEICANTHKQNLSHKFPIELL